MQGLRFARVCVTGGWSAVEGGEHDGSPCAEAQWEL